MPSSALHRFAILLALCTLCLVALVALSRGGLLLESERLMGTLLAALSIIQAAWATVADPRASVKAVSWVLAVLAGALPFASPILKASGSQVLVALAVAVMVLTSPAWQRGPRPVEDEGTPSMRTFGWLCPAGVVIQVALGAGMRYEWLPVWPHVTGSLVIGALLMFAGMAALQSYGGHDSLRRVATVLLWCTGLQLTLGMAAYGVRMASEREAWMIYLTVAHVVTGALMMGAVTAFALQVFYHVRETLLVREAAA